MREDTTGRAGVVRRARFALRRPRSRARHPCSRRRALPAGQGRPCRSPEQRGSHDHLDGVPPVVSSRMPTSIAGTDVGVDGFVCSVQRLAGMGGRNSFTGDPAKLDGDGPLAPAHAARVTDRGAGVETGHEAVPRLLLCERTSIRRRRWRSGSTTPSGPRPSFPAVKGSRRRRARWVSGLAFDQELYAQQGGRQHRDVGVGLPGQRAARRRRSQSGAPTRAADDANDRRTRSRRRHPRLLHDFSRRRSTSWCRPRSTTPSRPYEQSVQIDFWDGLTSVEGYRVDRLPQRHVLQDPAPRHVGLRVHLSLQPALRAALETIVELGLCSRPGLRVPVRLDQLKDDPVRGGPFARHVGSS